jgi:hypothetical protein
MNAPKIIAEMLADALLHWPKASRKGKALHRGVKPGGSEK